jgi:hypothetical protein
MRVPAREVVMRRRFHPIGVTQPRTRRPDQRQSLA